MRLEEVADVLILQVGRHRQQREESGEHGQVCCFEGKRVVSVEVEKLGPMDETVFAQCGPSFEVGRVNALNFLQEKE